MVKLRLIKAASGAELAFEPRSPSFPDLFVSFFIPHCLKFLYKIWVKHDSLTEKNKRWSSSNIRNICYMEYSKDFLECLSRFTN